MNLSLSAANVPPTQEESRLTDKEDKEVEKKIRNKKMPTACPFGSRFLILMVRPIRGGLVGDREIRAKMFGILDFSLQEFQGAG